MAARMVRSALSVCRKTNAVATRDKKCTRAFTFVFHDVQFQEDCRRPNAQQPATSLRGSLIISVASFVSVKYLASMIPFVIFIFIFSRRRPKAQSAAAASLASSSEPIELKEVFDYVAHKNGKPTEAEVCLLTRVYFTILVLESQWRPDAPNFLQIFLCGRHVVSSRSSCCFGCIMCPSLFS